MDFIKKYTDINNEVKFLNKNIKLVVVTKSQEIKKIESFNML